VDKRRSSGSIFSNASVFSTQTSPEKIKHKLWYEEKTFWVAIEKYVATVAKKKKKLGLKRYHSAGGTNSADASAAAADPTQSSAEATPDISAQTTPALAKISEGDGAGGGI